MENPGDFHPITKKALEIKAVLTALFHTTHRKKCGKPPMHIRWFYAEITEKNRVGTSFVNKSFGAVFVFFSEKEFYNRVFFTN